MYSEGKNSHPTNLIKPFLYVEEALEMQAGLHPLAMIHLCYNFTKKC